MSEKVKIYRQDRAGELQAIEHRTNPLGLSDVAYKQERDAHANTGAPTWTDLNLLETGGKDQDQYADSRYSLVVGGRDSHLEVHAPTIASGMQPYIYDWRTCKMLPDSYLTVLDAMTSAEELALLT